MDVCGSQEELDYPGAGEVNLHPVQEQFNICFLPLGHLCSPLVQVLNGALLLVGLLTHLGTLFLLEIHYCIVIWLSGIPKRNLGNLQGLL